MAIRKPMEENGYQDIDIDNLEQDLDGHISSGWDAANEFLEKKKTGDYPTDTRLSEETQLFYFLENEPFAIYRQYWVEKEGKKSYVALGDEDPLSVVAGLQARPKFAFNVLNITSGEPVHEVLTASTMLARQLQQHNDDPRRGPLSKGFWEISRQGKGPQTMFSVQLVKAKDLSEEWNMEPEDIYQEAKSIVAWDSSIIKPASYEDHLEIARNLVKGS